MDGKACRAAKNTQGDKFRQFGEKDTQDKSCSYGNHSRQYIFPHEDLNQIAFSHSEDVIKSELFLSPAYQK